ncbi:MAG: hypothetical protein ACXACK_18440 [Candidatus Hodarchaeales archaeon]|jgi:hypothetical protein
MHSSYKSKVIDTKPDDDLCDEGDQEEVDQVNRIHYLTVIWVWTKELEDLWEIFTAHGDH